jgi:cysteine desulfurase
MVFQNKRIYLDYASITPIDRRVLKEMQPFLVNRFVNASSLYKEGVENKKSLEEARGRLAKILASRPDEIIFTSGGTESNNLALLGIFEAAREKMRSGKDAMSKRAHVITTMIEHPSILEVCEEIERRGGRVTYVRVGKDGLVDPREIKKALRAETVLVSVMYANNEIGTIQPVREIGKVIRNYQKLHTLTHAPPDRPLRAAWPSLSLSRGGGFRFGAFPYFHTDASQAAEYLDLNVERLGVDFMTLDGSKIYGPRGAGLLFARRRKEFRPITFGGGQEVGRRPGTENLAAAVGLAAALELSEKIKEKESARLTKLRDYFIEQIRENIPSAILNGAEKTRLPNNINFCFPGLDAELSVLCLDAKGIAISSVTSCRINNEDSSSYVIEALGRKNCSRSSLRISLGRQTTKAEIDYCLKILYSVANGRTL